MMKAGVAIDHHNFSPNFQLANADSDQSRSQFDFWNTWYHVEERFRQLEITTTSCTPDKVTIKIELKTDKLFCYTLTALPWSLSTVDGGIQKAAKSKTIHFDTGKYVTHVQFSLNATLFASMQS